MTVAGLIFDMDGVLCDSEPFILKAAQTHLNRQYGIVVPRVDFEEFIGAGDDAFVGGPARKHGVEPVLPADKEATYDVYEELVAGALQPLPGVLTFIREAKQAGIALSVASSADMRKVRVNLEAIGLDLSIFDCVVTGDDVINKKPDPEAFLKAAAGMGRDPGACLVVEDAVNGVEAAKAAGAMCLGLTTSFSEDRLRAAGADFIAAHLADVPMTLRTSWGLASHG